MSHHRFGLMPFSSSVWMASLSVFLVTSCGDTGFFTSDKKVKTNSAKSGSNADTGQADAEKTQQAGQSGEGLAESGTGEDPSDAAGGRVSGAGPANQKTFVDGNGKVLSVEDTAQLNSCLDDWQNHPYTQKTGEPLPVDVYDLTLGLPIFQGGINDTSETELPKLVLVKAAINILSVTEHKFWNPKGWYCLHTGVDVLAKTTVSLHCNAHLSTGKAGSGSTTSIGSSVTGKSSQVGVHVLSQVQTVEHCPE